MRPATRIGVVITLSLVIAATTAACKRRSDTPDPGVPYPSGTESPKLATFIFKEEGRLFLMTVGVNATRFHDKDAFVPFTIMLANKSKSILKLDRESFTLVDPTSGARYGLASVDEVRRQGKQEYDRKLMDVEHLLSKLGVFTKADSNYFPITGLLRDQIELHPFMYLLDVLYFPRPESDLLGKTFEMHVTARGLEQPLFVVFTVPER